MPSQIFSFFFFFIKLNNLSVLFLISQTKKINWLAFLSHQLILKTCLFWTSVIPAELLLQLPKEHILQSMPLCCHVFSLPCYRMFCKHFWQQARTPTLMVPTFLIWTIQQWDSISFYQLSVGKKNVGMEEVCLKT